jgi:hypothetical protein
MFRYSFALVGIVIAIAGGIYAISATHSANQLAGDVSSSPGAGADSDSLFQEANLTKALDTFHSKFGTLKVTDFKIEPGSIKATTSTGIVTVGKHGETENLGVDTGATGQTGFTVNAVHPAAVVKLTGELAKQGITQADISYFLLSSDISGTSKPTWGVYTDSKGDFSADSKGGQLHKLGTTTTVITGSDSGSDSGTSSASSLQACLAKAGTDADKVKACAGQ